MFYYIELQNQTQTIFFQFCTCTVKILAMPAIFPRKTCPFDVPIDHSLSMTQNSLSQFPSERRPKVSHITLPATLCELISSLNKTEAS